jgi:hypothetical protein
MHSIHFPKVSVIFSSIILYSNLIFSQEISIAKEKEIYWSLGQNNSIVWNCTQEHRLPHEDNIEMDGQLVAAIIRYRVDENKQLYIARDVIFPQLRRFPGSTDPEWYNYRAYLRSEYTDEISPVLTHYHTRILPGLLDSVSINGKITFYHHPTGGLQITRSFFPSTNARLLVEKWTIRNDSDTLETIITGMEKRQQTENGLYGVYKRTIFSDVPTRFTLHPHAEISFGIYFAAQLNKEPLPVQRFAQAELLRDNFLDSIRNNLVLESPDSILNTLFYFSKIHAAESIYQTKMGLVHSPGGGTYYTGVWANDQGEYSAPLFPYLGYSIGVTAAMNAYRMFLKHIPRNGEKIWASFEMDGDLPCCSKDRGDAAMLAFGATHFCLASGNIRYADTLWPLITWALSYCEKMKTTDGVIASKSDELEGRFPSGTANLSTSILYYGALQQAAVLASSMHKEAALIREYNDRREKLSLSIENYFGADIEGLHTYRYYKENTTLRAWICLPLVMGITTRKEGTLDALFSKLWTDDGVRTELDSTIKGKEVFWDRGTLYAFRGTFKAGAADLSLPKLHAFSTTRLLGYRTPYVVEAWPENDMAQLSAESALYCRIYTEGILGLAPAGFHSFTLQPHLPSGWNKYCIRNINAFGGRFDIIVTKEGNALHVSVLNRGKLVYDHSGTLDQVLFVDLNS